MFGLWCDLKGLNARGIDTTNPHFEHTHTMSGNTQVYVPPMSGSAQVYVSPPVQPRPLTIRTNPYASWYVVIAQVSLALR